MDLDNNDWKFGNIINCTNKRNYSKIKAIFIKHKILLGKGLAEIYNCISTIQFVILAAIGLKVYGIDLPTIIYPIAGIIGLLLAWLVGKLWDKAHLYQYEYEFANARNPFAKDMREKLDIEEGVKE